MTTDGELTDVVNMQMLVRPPESVTESCDMKGADGIVSVSICPVRPAASVSPQKFEEVIDVVVRVTYWAVDVSGIATATVSEHCFPVFEPVFMLTGDVSIKRPLPDPEAPPPPRTTSPPTADPVPAVM